MKINLRHPVALTAAAVLAATVATISPASAEGSWSSHITNWSGGEESRRWRDTHADSASTTVSFSRCNFDGATGSALNLYRVRDLLPDVSIGGRTNTCNTVSWGQIQTSGSYYFQYGSGHLLTVGSVVTSY
ncbi:hypothetical protein [Streptomyces rishiriensis]|uniref:hypothetical protein n=1 Tax=Streptomyces rishiriensis TaxID=68264 RepID=UPI0037D11AE9